ncbi:MAG: SDR family oxidoreductase [Crocinitomicaceae bacterium]|nr:SDR family oxidoreductase [Crocinitomicaceae bacterium]
MNIFQDKIVWVTGASAGIGMEIAKQTAEKGAKLILSARNKEKLQKLKLSLPNSDQHLVLPLDLEHSGNFNELVSIVITEFGNIDFLFNNGGLSQRSEVHETPMEIDRRIMEINYFGNIALAKAVLPVFRRQKSGHFIVISSIAGKFGFFLRSAYSASKHALHGFYESLLLEEEKNNVFVTIACPGKINTDISMNALNATGGNHGVMDHNQATGMSVEACVTKLLLATSAKKKEILIGKKEIKAVKLKRFMPRLFWKVIRKQSAT